MSGWGGRRAQQIRTRMMRQSDVCWICGDRIDVTLHYLDPGAFSVDHVTPRARGGTDDPSNLRPAHRRCNRAKSDNTHAPVVRRSGTLK